MTNTKARERKSYLALHDSDPVDYHLRLSKLGIKCGFCEQREKYGKVVTNE